MSISRHHADWLNLVEHSGPFFSLPVLSRVFPHGLDPRDTAQAKRLRESYEVWQENPTAPGKQHAWVMHVLTELLDYPSKLIAEGQAIPPGLEARMAEMGETLRPDLALLTPDGREGSGQAKMLISCYPSEQRLDKTVTGSHWKATPATRMMELLHGAGVPLGLATNGEQWMLVYAPRGETTGYASWYASLWLDEPITLRAFHSLLGTHRFFGVADVNTPLGMLKESADDQQEVTDQLGYQVREAVEVLVQSFDALDKESGRKLLHGVAEASLYDAALTVMMRLVFLFSAEERGMLQLGKPLYDENYAVSTLQEMLQEVADLYGEEVLERRTDAWARLLASFRSVHGGVSHQDLSMPAYGGSLFDPDRYPFLEGRAAGTCWKSTAAEPLAINNRVVLHLLNALQRLRMKGATAGSEAETRRVSFRALGVEQIGHVYEGLLDHTAITAGEPVIGLKGTSKKKPEIPLATLEGLMAQGEVKLVAFLKEETGRSPSVLKKLLIANNLLDDHKLLIACGQDQDLLARVRPFAGLIREDSFERPLVVLPSSVYVTGGTTRRSTGTHYTPPSLTEPVVRHALEPLVYMGPAEGWLPDRWKLKSPGEILELKICDMAMGSGAFLVQACRYLAERLVEAWENEEQQHPNEMLITPDGGFSTGEPSERMIPADAEERLAVARRVVADRCLYGVDINPMAVEMAKLSLWLINMDATRPFSFLDHAFKCGDSLLGITSLEQLENFSLRSDAGKQKTLATLNLSRQIEEAKTKRIALETMPSDTPEQITAKTALNLEAEKAVAKLNSVANVLVTVELMGLKGRAYLEEREVSADYSMTYWDSDAKVLTEFAKGRLGDRQCFHWALIFPEIMGRGGFDAIIGNPPFMGGQKITGLYGAEYRELLVECVAHGVRKSADYCAYLLLRSHELVKKDRGCIGIIATSTIAEGVSREAGLDQIVLDSHIYRARTNFDWPGEAALTVSCVWIKRGQFLGAVLNDIPVDNISTALRSSDIDHSKPYSLRGNDSLCYQGVIPLGDGFYLNREEAELFASENKNLEVVKPYLTGRILNSQLDTSPKSWIINFFDWPLDRASAPPSYIGPVASDYPSVLARVKLLVKPDRDNNPRKARREKWWQYAEKAAGLYKEITRKRPERILAIVMTAVHFKFEWVGSDFIFDQTVVPLLVEDDWGLSVLQSSIHLEWAYEQGSSFGAGAAPRYNPSRCFESFPLPSNNLKLLDDIGRRYYLKRSEIVRVAGIGLTDLYNLFHDPACTNPAIIELRVLQLEMDQAVARAYGWQKIELCHGFHETKQGIRYTMSKDVRPEVLGRLLELNHQRYAEEVAAGLHEKKGNKDAGTGKRGRNSIQAASHQVDMFS